MQLEKAEWDLEARREETKRQQDAELAAVYKLAKQLQEFAEFPDTRTGRSYANDRLDESPQVVQWKAKNMLNEHQRRQLGITDVRQAPHSVGCCSD